MRNTLILILTVTALFQPTVALAYIGPGLGVGAISAVLGIIAAVVMAFIALIWYPFKRFLSKNKSAVETEDAS